MSAVPYYHNFIGGEWVQGTQSRTVLNPATNTAVAEMAEATPADVDVAMAAARRCVTSGVLSRPRPAERVTLLLAIAREIRELAEPAAIVLCQENGKPLSVARGEFDEAARYFEYYAGMADKIEGTSIPLGVDYVDFTSYEPYGISVQIVPWNFPPSICARSLAPALAAGNAVVVKSPEISPLAMTFLAAACERAGLPKGALSILSGSGAGIGDHLTGHAETDQIVFTGSVPTGQHILRVAAKRTVPTVMELGGKSAAVVHADANIDQVIDSVRNGIFFNSGQVCSALSRLLVHRSRIDEVTDRLVELTDALTLGPGMDDADTTPLISADQLDRVEAMCTRAVDQGARCITGGSRVPNTAGHFMPPTLFIDAATDSEIFQQEVFGPVLVIHAFDTEAEAITLANGTRYGLVAGVFSSQLDRALRTARQLRAGQVFVNEWFAGGIETPFGGVGSSGFGREKGQEALFNYVQTQNIAIRVRADTEDGENET